MSRVLPPPIGRLVEVDGRRLHINDKGVGSPAVVFESGGASWSLDWHLVQTEVARFTRACSYDRAGFGWSEPGPKPRTAGRIAGELDTLLGNAGIPGPWVLVGASFGGHVVRLLASRHPDEVAGVVLLDARHEEIGTRMPPGWKKLESAGAQMYRAMLGASRLGLLGVLGKLGGERAVPPIARKLPGGLRQTYLAVGFQPRYFEANLDELAASAESDREVVASGTLGGLPLTVVRHGRPDLFARMPSDQAAVAEQVWQELQAALARLSTDSRLETAERSGHAIQVDEPEKVVNAIRRMVEAARARETTRPA